MTTAISVRLDEGLLDAVDRARVDAGRGRSEVVREALQLWLRQRELADAVRRHEIGYRKRPVSNAEFVPVLGAQQWPK